MELKEQLTSLNPSNRLKVLGVKQDSQFYWDEESLASNYFIHNKDYKWNKRTSAFSVAELGEILPDKLIVERTQKESGCFLSICKSDYLNNWRVGYYFRTETNYLKQYKGCEFSNEKLADALALMLIYLIENKLSGL